MDNPWFYYPETIAGHIAALDEASAKHAVQVLRLKEGDTIHLTNGAGLLHTATIQAAGKKQCSVQIISTEERARQTHRQVAMAISPLKNTSRFEWFLEKATELGVAEIFPIISHRTVREHFRQERLQTICVSAMLQSQQTWLPTLHKPQSYEQLIAQQSANSPQRYHHRWIAHCMHSEKHHLVQAVKTGMQDSLLLIGPEGDFTETEVMTAEAEGFVAVSLGDTRLRTETAGVVAASLLCLLP
ncbi:MAG TPA: RsmE family RNA methyltransferase [Phnomibacter sp.]|nr:RsmE family RNA methyltransferase [Phnomibacter sp.]